MRLQGMKLHKKLAGQKAWRLAAALEALQAAPPPAVPSSAPGAGPPAAAGIPAEQPAGGLQPPLSGDAGHVATAHSCPTLTGFEPPSRPVTAAPSHVLVAPLPAADKGMTGGSSPRPSGASILTQAGSAPPAGMKSASPDLHAPPTRREAGGVRGPGPIVGSDVYDPPSKAPAGKDVTRRFPSGLAHYWCALL